MPEDDTAACAEVAEFILGYLRDHPHAADTVEGIHRWWLPDRLAQLGPDRLQRCLDELVAQARVSRCVLVNGTSIYGGALQCGA
jgi:hypothetical protein